MNKKIFLLLSLVACSGHLVAGRGDAGKADRRKKKAGDAQKAGGKGGQQRPTDMPGQKAFGGDTIPLHIFKFKLNAQIEKASAGSLNLETIGNCLGIEKEQRKELNDWIFKNRKKCPATVGVPALQDSSPSTLQKAIAAINAAR